MTEYTELLHEEIEADCENGGEMSMMTVTRRDGEKKGVRKRTKNGKEPGLEHMEGKSSGLQASTSMH